MKIFFKTQKLEVITIVIIGSDHGGFKLKNIIVEHLQSTGVDVLDMGTYTDERVDYPDIATGVCQKVLLDEGNFGVLVCGTGVGMSMAANKINGIRAALCSDTYSAKMTRAHNDANVVCMGERVVGPGLAVDIVDAFLASIFEGGRHKTRVDKITQIEKNRIC